MLGDVAQHLQQTSRLIISAQPGAGKSTCIPAFLSQQDWAQGQRIVVLQPRRVAARSLADFLAGQQGEKIGQTFGLTVRGQRQVSAQTRVEFVTEGILTRRIQNDPELTGVAAVVFDEFHERHLNTDLGLALCLDVQNALRPELRMVVMSATLDGERLSTWLDAPLVESEGRRFPVTIEHQGVDQRRSSFVQLQQAVLSALTQCDHGVLVFLPGRREIEQLQDALRVQNNSLDIRCLYGELPLSEQARALTASETGQPRVVLATNLAETSLTVPDIDYVVDTGEIKRPVYDPVSGLSGLKLGRISRASADQRAGRAGRTVAGTCIRLWSKGERLDSFDEPAIKSADLRDLAMELALWGAESDDLSWLDQPPPGHLRGARQSLLLLGLIDQQHRPTELAKAVAGWGTDLRLALMLEQSGELQSLACDLAALLEGRGLSGNAGDDFAAVCRNWFSASIQSRPTSWKRLEQQARHWRRRCDLAESNAADRCDDEDLITVLMQAFPDRVAIRRQGEDQRFLMANGKGARLRHDSALSGAAALIVLDAQLADSEALINLGLLISEADINRHLESRFQLHQRIEIDTQGQLQASQDTCLGALSLARKNWNDVPGDQIIQAWIDLIRKRGLALLDWREPAVALRQRAAFAAANDRQNSWPDGSDVALLEQLDGWLSPWLSEIRSIRQLKKIDLHQALSQWLGYPLVQQLNELAPSSLKIPSGRKVSISYEQPDQPKISAKLQEFFGLTQQPRLPAGHTRLAIELLSPAGRPLAVTQDLSYFWQEVYPQVRKENRGRYPKHPWPEDPLTAKPTAMTKARMG